MYKKLFTLFCLALMVPLCALADQIPVAILSTNADNVTKTLTFTYADESEATATNGQDGAYKLNEGYNEPGWIITRNWRNPDAVTTTVEFKPSFANARPTTTSKWFLYMSRLDTIVNIKYLNTSNVTNMHEMFHGCSSLTNLDLGSFKTQNVTDMFGMFWGCSRLTSINVSHLDTKKVTNMEFMFDACSSLTSLDVSKINTENVTKMGNMFGGCSNLTSLDVNNFNTKNVTDMYGMFCECSSLTSLDVSKFKTNKLENASSMFRNCFSLTKLNVGNNDFDKAEKRLEFDGVGSPSWPCYLIVDSAFQTSVLGGNDANEFYHWNDGYFVLSQIASVPLVEEKLNDDGITKTLFFYCSDKDVTQDKDASWEVAYPLNKTDEKPKWIKWAEYQSDTIFTAIVFDKSFMKARPVSTRCWFQGMSRLSTIKGIEYLKTSNVTNMTSMFEGCSSLSTLDVSNFNTENVMYMGGMFEKCSSLTNLDVSNFNTGNVTSMTNMFFGCSSLLSLDMSNFNMENVIYMESMFNSCSSLTSIDISNFNLKNVESIQYLCAGCTNLRKLTVGNNDFKNIKNTWETFDNVGLCYIDRDEAFQDSVLGEQKPGGFYSWLGGVFTLTSHIPIVKLNTNEDGTKTLTFTYGDITSATATNGKDGMYVLNYKRETPGWITATEGSLHMTFPCPDETITKVVFDKSFSNARPVSCYRWFNQLSLLDTIEGIQYLNTSEVTDMRSMFLDCASLRNIDLSNFNTSKVTDMSYMFISCLSLSSLDVRNFNTESVTNMNSMFSDCRSLTSLDVSHFNTSKVTDMTGMFGNCTKLTSIDVSHFNTENVTSMGGRECRQWGMFEGCSCLTRLDLSHFNTSKVQNMYHMFLGCVNLIDIDLRNFNTENVTDMNNMFFGCSNLTSLDLSNFNTEKVTDMTEMFEGCSRLAHLDVSSFNTENVTDMFCMFEDCSSLTSLDVSNFNTEKVTNMRAMFSGCSSLTSLDLSNFNTGNVTDMSYMFSDCSKLTNLDVSNFNTEKVTDMRHLFIACSNLKCLDVSNFNTDNVTDMSYMFGVCSSLTILDLSNFNTQPLNNAEGILIGCKSLSLLNLGNNDFGNESKREHRIFDGVGNLDRPCKLIVNTNFDKSVLGEKLTKTGANYDYYKWLGGYFTFDDIDTKLNNVLVYCNNKEVPAYNLAGQRVDGYYKGVVIVNGKKMIRK